MALIIGLGIGTFSILLGIIIEIIIIFLSRLTKYP